MVMVNPSGIEHKIQVILKEINEICKGKKIVVAFSGGMDSTVVSKLAIEALGSKRVKAISVSFENYSYIEGLKNIHSISCDLGLKLKIIPGKMLQEIVLRKGPACNQCTRKVKLGLVKKAAGTRLVLTGSNQSDTWGKMGLKLHNNIYAPLFNMCKKEIKEIAEYFNLDIKKIGENIFREGCKLKHLLKPLANPDYHGRAADEANEILLETLKKEKLNQVLANVKIIGPLSKNIGLVNLLPFPDEKIKSKIIMNLKKLKIVEEIVFLDNPIKLIIKANRGQFSNLRSRHWLEKGRLQPDFAVPINIEWRLTTNKNLGTFQVVDYKIDGEYNKITSGKIHSYFV